MAESNSLSLVTPTDGVPTTTSLIVSEGIGAQHASVIRLVRDNQGDFEEFGGVGFEIQPFETPGGTQSRTIAVLNRDHAMLLMTYMRNTPIVRQFKKNLIRAFLELERRLATPAELSRAEILTMALQAEEERLALEAKTRELEPKATAYDAFMDADGKYSMGTVAKMLGLGQNKLFRELRNAGVLIPKGPMYNTPYQQYMHHFEVRATTIRHSDGTESVRYTTYVQPSGINFIRRKLGLTTQGEIA